jgi:excisionase family DNA binding protein
LRNPSCQEAAETADRLAAIEAKLETLLQRAGSPESRYLTVDGAANYTSLSPESVRRLLAGGKLTALRPVGGRVLIDRRELDSAVLGATKRPTSGRGRRG